MSAGPAELPLRAPGDEGGLLAIVRRRYLLRLLVRKEIRVRYQGSVLGILWSYVKPAVQFVVFYIALGVFLELNKGTENYAVYLFSGVVVMNLFGEAFGNSTRSIVGNAPLIKKIYLPRELFPVASLVVAFIHFLPQLLVLLVAAVATGWRPSLAQILAVLLGILIVCLFSLGLGLMFGAVNVTFRDSENVVDLFIMVATWLSPVLYTWDRVAAATSELVFTIYRLNPLTSAVELLHWGMWFPTTDGTAPLPPNMGLFAGIALAAAVAVLVIGQAVFRGHEGRFAQEL